MKQPLVSHVNLRVCNPYQIILSIHCLHFNTFECGFIYLFCSFLLSQGYAAGNAIPSPLKNVEKEFLKKYWAKWKASHTGRWYVYLITRDSSDHQNAN